jgi:hypothetical protein
LGSQTFGLLFLVGDVPQALLQAGDLAEPLHPLGLSQALAGVGLDLVDELPVVADHFLGIDRDASLAAAVPFTVGTGERMVQGRLVEARHNRARLRRPTPSSCASCGGR